MFLPRLLGESCAAAAPFPAAAAESGLRSGSPGCDREIAALLIEANGAVYDDTYWWRWITRVVNQLGVPVHFSDFYLRWEQRYLPQVCREECDVWQALARQLRDCGLSPGTCDELLTAAEARRRCLDRGLRPLPGVVETLANLGGRGCILVGLANRPFSINEFHETLVRLHVASYFDALHTALELGGGLCEADSLHSVLDQLPVAASQVALVSACGTHRASAKSLGMLTVSLESHPGQDAELWLNRFSDLPHRLNYRSLRRRAG